MKTMKGCVHCGATIDTNIETCPKCHTKQSDRIFTNTANDEHSLMQTMTDSQRLLFVTQMNGVRKQSSTGTMLALFLGGVGAHHFYLGNNGMGVLYLLFCWTFIPAILGFFEAFMMRSRVEAHNNYQAVSIAAQIKSLQS